MAIPEADGRSQAICFRPTFTWAQADASWIIPDVIPDVPSPPGDRAEQGKRKSVSKRDLNAFNVRSEEEVKPGEEDVPASVFF